MLSKGQVFQSLGVETQYCNMCTWVTTFPKKKKKKLRMNENHQNHN